MSTVRSVELLKGALDLMYGSEAVIGVVVEGVVVDAGSVLLVAKLV